MLLMKGMINLNRKGFTLIELLAVIAILGLIVTTVSIAVTKVYNDNVNKSEVIFFFIIHIPPNISIRSKVY